MKGERVQGMQRTGIERSKATIRGGGLSTESELKEYRGEGERERSSYNSWVQGG